MGERTTNAVKAAEETLRAEQLDWEVFCADKDELEEPVDESDRWVNIQRWVVEALLDAARTEGRGEGQPVAWAYEYTNHLKGDRAPGGWLRAVAFEAPTRARVNAGFARNVQPLYASPIREPEISRTDLIKLLADHFGFRPYEQMAEDKSDLRGKIRDGYDYDINEPTRSHLSETADAILNLAPVGGRGEGWRPISEAPKDGTRFLAWPAHLDGGVTAAVETWWYEHPSTQGWITDAFDCGDYEFAPTYWSPLPPQEQGGMK